MARPFAKCSLCFKAVSIIAIGDTEEDPHPPKRPLDAVLHSEHFSRDTRGSGPRRAVSTHFGNPPPNEIEGGGESRV